MAWYNNSWLYRFKITSDQTKVNEAIDNVFYDFANAPAGFWTHVKSDGGDVRITTSDQVTEVAREISGFNVGSTVGSLFFKATGLSDSINTDFYVYYGNSSASEPAAGSTFGKNNVWTSYLCVWHLDEASGNVTDSKGNVTGTNTGVTLGATGKLRTGGTWDNTADQITAGDNFDITAASLSISAWINPNTVVATYTIVCKQDPSDSIPGYWFSQNSSGGLRLVISSASALATQNSNNSVITASVLQHVAVTYNGSNIRFYVSAVEQGAPAETIIPADSTNTFTIGNFSDFNFDDFKGVIDEVRVSTSVRSANWWSTEYNNQNAPNTFWTSGSEENVPTSGGGLPFITTLGAKRI